MGFHESFHAEDIGKILDGDWIRTVHCDAETVESWL